jgi:predicted hotdog family 3-hydroxylacyl-ACP dehydratase
MSQFRDERPEAWIPQRGAMRLIDRVVSVDEKGSVAEVDVPHDGLFVRDGSVPAWIGLEYMAQTVSAWAGGRARRAGGEPRVGLLLGTRRFEAMRSTFPAGSRLRVEATCELMGDNGLGVFDCRVLLEGEPLATARISVFDPPDGAQWLQEPRT